MLFVPVCSGGEITQNRIGRIGALAKSVRSPRCFPLGRGEQHKKGAVISIIFNRHEVLFLIGIFPLLLRNIFFQQLP